MVDIRSDIEELRFKIWYHAKKYYVDCAPEISDYEYDKLFAELVALEKEHPQLITTDSPTQRVAPEPVSHFAKFTHRVPMLSIDNTYSVEEIREFDARLHKLLESKEKIAYVVEPKIDGLAISLWYERGTLARGVTRGDGKTGEVATANVRTIHTVPLRLMTTTPPEMLEVRGEVYLSAREFEKINEERSANSLPLFANPRNAAAGTLKLLDARLVAQRKLDFFVHSLGYIEAMDAITYSESLQFFQRWGLPVNPHRKLAADIEEVIAMCEHWRLEPPELPYNTDGMVIKVDNLALRNVLGVTSRSPRWVIAYKFAPEEAQVKLKDVVVQVGKGGTLTPVAILDPVFLAGSTVSRASLHNYEDIARKDIRIGDTVSIAKAGEIIPQVMRSHPELRDGTEKIIFFPQRCPSCEGEVKKDPDGVYLRCQNPQCGGGFKSRLKFFASRHGMEIKGLGDKLAEQLVDQGIVTTFGDLYNLTLEQLTSLERMGTKSAENLLDSIQQSKRRDPARLLCALGIRHVGTHVAQILVDKFLSLDILAQASVEQLLQISEVGPTVAQAVFDFFQGEYGQNILTQLRTAGVCFARTTSSVANSTTANSPWSGKNIVLTGTLQNFTRDQVKDLIVQAGGRVTTSVSKKTDMVIAGENPGSKLTEARSLGVLIIDEAELVRQLVATGLYSNSEVKKE